MRGQEQEQEQHEQEERGIRGTGYEFGKKFCSLQLRGFVTLLVVAFLYDDDNKVSHPLVRSLVRSGSRFFNDFIIGVRSYMRVNVTLDNLSVVCGRVPHKTLVAVNNYLTPICGYRT